MILFPILVLVLVLVFIAQLWLVASGTAWELVRHHRRGLYHPALRAVIALSAIELVAVLLLGLVLLGDR
ncbi:MAG TPA: hypothetical protein VFW12_02365 [Candidatus Limnocylindria bacterium]|nr:hypothetical protein [Candidatus Limnocylindria bacterium]